MIRFTLFSLLLSLTLYVSGQEQNAFEKLNFDELDSILKIHFNQGTYREGLPVSQAWIKKARAEKRDTLLAQGINEQGVLYWYLGKYPQALEQFLESRIIYKEVYGTEHRSYANALNNIAHLYQTLGDPQKALPMLLEALEIQERVLGTEHQDYANSLNNLAILYSKINQHQKAIATYLQAKEIIERTVGNQHTLYASAVNNLAHQYVKMGRFEEGMQYYLQARRISEKLYGRNHPDFAKTLNNLGKMHREMGNYAQALPLYLEAKDLIERTLGKTHPDYANLLNNMAVLYEQMNIYDKSETLYQQAIETRRIAVGVNHPSYGYTLTNMARMYARQGKHDQALPLYLEAMEIQENRLGTDHPYYATSLHNLASTYRALGRNDEALALLTVALRIRENVFGRLHHSYQLSQNNLSRIYLVSGRYEEAWQAVSQSLSDIARLPTPLVFDQRMIDQLISWDFYSFTQLSRLIETLNIVYYLLQKDNNMTERTHKQIILTDAVNALLVKARNEVSNEQDKLRVLSFSHDWLERSMEVLDPESQSEKAFSLADQNKSVLLLQATKSELAYRIGELPDSLVWKDRKLHDQQSRLQASLMQKLPTNTRDSLLSELNEVNLNIEGFIHMIAEIYPKYHQVRYGQADANVAEIQAMLDNQTALLEYVVVDSAVHIFSVDQQGVDWIKSPITNQELTDRIHALHSALSDYGSDSAYFDYAEQAHWFYNKLVAPAIAGKNGITNLIIVPDGELGHLPFEAFLVEAAPQQNFSYHEVHYLVKDYNISYNYSATLWKENREAPAPKNNGELLGVAADYEIELDTNMVAMRMATDQWRREKLTQLPAARREVEALQAKYEGFFAYDTLASEKTVKTMASEYAVLHFATHGILDNERPVLSSLAFTEDNDSTESNFWQAHEISKAQLNADLVVLSACETGYGKFERGNGVASLARAFMYAGAPSLIVSLWQVHDGSTSELMQFFYSNLDSGMKKDEALRKAKLQYLESAQGIMAHPAFWSPFITIGKTDTVAIKNKGDIPIRNLLVAALILLALIGVIRSRRKAVG